MTAIADNKCRQQTKTAKDDSKRNPIIPETPFVIWLKLWLSSLAWEVVLGPFALSWGSFTALDSQFLDIGSCLHETLAKFTVAARDTYGGFSRMLQQAPM